MSYTNIKKEKVLLIDGHNLFIRCWSVIPTLNDNGDHNGGTFGFLRSLRRLIVDHRATKVIVCWEGKRSTHRRKKIFSEYKANRSIPKRVVRAYDFEETPQKQLKDLKAQLQAVQQYLHLLPVYQLQVEYTEADDIIAYLASYRFPEIEKIIVSNDKDFLQLISDNVSVYRPATKKTMSAHELLEKTGIHPNNWLIVKTIEGDKSDNIPGIRGVGPKSILKYFPEVAESDEITTEKLFTICEEQSNINKTVSYKKIIAGKEIIERNYKLMQLTNIDLSLKSIQHIDDQLKIQKPKFEPFQLRVRFIKDGARDQVQSFEYWSNTFMPLNYRD